MQLAIDFEPRHLARTSDPATSHAAAAAARELQSQHHSEILAALQRFGPLGASGIASRCCLDAHQVGKRLHELEKAGRIALTGETVKSTAGRKEREWMVA